VSGIIKINKMYIQWCDLFIVTKLVASITATDNLVNSRRF